MRRGEQAREGSEGVGKLTGICIRDGEDQVPEVEHPDGGPEPTEEGAVRLNQGRRLGHDLFLGADKRDRVRMGLIPPDPPKGMMTV